MAGKELRRIFYIPNYVQDTELESSDDEIIILENPETPTITGDITRSKALLDAMNEDSSRDESMSLKACFLTQDENHEPYTFEDTFYCKDPEKRKSWREAIKKEIGNMEKCKVWSPVHKD